MKARKFLAVIITLAMFVSMAFAISLNVSADDAAPTTDIDLSQITPMPMPTVPVIPQDSNYAYVDGTIKEIRDYIGADGNPVEGKQIVSIQKGENEWTAIIDGDTYNITIGKTDRKAMSVGDDIRVFYNAAAPMALIYPPQYNAEFIALNFDKAKAITIARFDLNYTSLKDSLKLNISDNTEIVYQDGTKFEGDIKDLVNPSRKLVVIYSVTTASIPAQTTPEKIIVMYEKAVAPIYTLTDEDKANYAKTFENAQIVVNGKVLENAKAYMNNDLVLMIPVRAVAEALGYKVEWFEDTQSVQVGKNIFFTLGKDAYAFARMAPVSLGTAPVLRDDKTYVPLDMFNLPNPSETANIYWYFADGQIHIDTMPQDTEK